jgi:hypothetical protein
LVGIPNAFAVDARLGNNSMGGVSLIDGQTIIKLISTHYWTLEQRNQ